MHDLLDELWADDPLRSAIADVRTYVGNLYRLTARWCHTRELMRAGEPAWAVPLPEDVAAVYRARPAPTNWVCHPSEEMEQLPGAAALARRRLPDSGHDAETNSERHSQAQLAAAHSA
ncbi:hypothetical protein ACGFLT_09540 [Micromonospora chalcea]